MLRTQPLDARERLKLLAAIDEAEAKRQYLRRQPDPHAKVRCQHCSALIGALRRLWQQSAWQSR